MRRAFASASRRGAGARRPGGAQDGAALLGRAADAAHAQLQGTIAYQRASGVETARLIHVNDGGEEFEKLYNLDGPAREVIRSNGEVRCYYPDAKVVRVEPRTFRNAFPSLSPQQQSSLAQYYTVRKGGIGRVAGLEAQAWTFEPKDGLRYGHELWTDPTTGILLKARMINERGEVVEQIAFLDIVLGAKLGPEAAKPTCPCRPRTGRSGGRGRASWSVRRPDGCLEAAPARR
jgi:sigma-E factor negative regulatory protein RseB